MALTAPVLLVLICVLGMLTDARDYTDAKTRGIAQVLWGYDDRVAATAPVQSMGASALGPSKADPFGGPPR